MPTVDMNSNPVKSPRTIRELLESIAGPTYQEGSPEKIPGTYLLANAAINLLDDGYSIDQDASDKLISGELKVFKEYQEHLQKFASHQCFPLTL